MVARKKRPPKQKRRARYGYKIRTKKGWYVRLFFTGEATIITCSVTDAFEKVRGNVEHARWRSHEAHSGYELINLSKVEHEKLNILWKNDFKFNAS